MRRSFVTSSSGAPADLYLQSQPRKHFRGTVVGLGWAVLPENGTSPMGLPSVERSLDWIRLAARFPVRIKVENPDDSFRLGASAVATVRRHLAHCRPMSPSALIDFLRRELAPTPGRGSATFRLTLACLVVTIPILTHRIPHAPLIMFVMFLITQEDTAATLIGSILGVVGLTIGLGLALLAWEFSLDIPWLRLCFLAVFLFGGLFLKRVLTIGALGTAIGLPAAVIMILPDILAGPGSAGRVRSLGLVVRNARSGR